MDLMPDSVSAALAQHEAAEERKESAWEHAQAVYAETSAGEAVTAAFSREDFNKALRETLFLFVLAETLPSAKERADSAVDADANLEGLVDKLVEDATQRTAERS